MTRMEMDPTYRSRSGSAGSLGRLGHHVVVKVVAKLILILGLLFVRHAPPACAQRVAGPRGIHGVVWSSSELCVGGCARRSARKLSSVGRERPSVGIGGGRGKELRRSPCLWPARKLCLAGPAPAILSMLEWGRRGVELRCGRGGAVRITMAGVEVQA